ncbi:MAG: hypothetical protein Q4B13_02155 [Lautropia sp.]|nr:hypothetical protein [Lautropia sp.]
MDVSAHSSPVRQVTLVSGPDADSRRACIQGLTAGVQRHDSARRSLWLQTGEFCPTGPVSGQANGRLAGAFPASPDHTLAAGCICCLGGPAFRTTLVRLLRQSAWHHLFLEVSQEGEHLLRMVDQLRLPPFDQHLRLTALIRAVPAGESASDASAMLRLPVPAARLSTVAAENAWSSAEFCRGSWRYADPVLSPGGAVKKFFFPASSSLRWVFQRWLPRVGVPTRQEALEALQVLAGVPGVQGCRAVLLTARSSYDWWFMSREAAAETAIQAEAAFPDLPEISPWPPDLSTSCRPRETDWRLDNRLWLGLAQGTDLNRLKQAMMTLRSLWC